MKNITFDMIHNDLDHKTRSGTIGFGEQCQVILYNDDRNTTDHVVECLVRIFGHPEALAKKLMLEAHQKGRTIAQVEEHEIAILHRKQLEDAGLLSDIEAI